MPFFFFSSFQIKYGSIMQFSPGSQKFLSFFAALHSGGPFSSVPRGQVRHPADSFPEQDRGSMPSHCHILLKETALRCQVWALKSLERGLQRCVFQSCKIQHRQPPVKETRAVLCTRDIWWAMSCSWFKSTDCNQVDIAPILFPSLCAPRW